MRIVLVFVAVLFVLRTAAAGDVQPDPARTFSAHLQDGGEALAGELGRYGAWLVQSQERLDGLLATFQKHNAVVENQLGKIDFSKENLVVVFHFGDEGDQFVLKEVSAPPQAASPIPNVQLDVQFGMSYIIYKQRPAATAGVWRCFGVPVPRYFANTVSVYTFHPANGGPNPDLKSARLEWEWTISPETGEAVGGLCAKIETKGDQPADEIPVRFTLKADQAEKVQDGQFARPAGPIHVWDGKYSKGYRSHAFEVTSPDGKMHLLRPEVKENWDKNIPHPVEITSDAPYVLPNWVEGNDYKSLKALGLDARQKGTYRITGIYQEVQEPAQNGAPEMWGGIVRSDTLIVTR